MIFIGKIDINNPTFYSSTVIISPLDYFQIIQYLPLVHCQLSNICLYLLFDDNIPYYYLLTVIWYVMGKYMANVGLLKHNLKI